jgi:hypothetical protein
MLYHHNKKTDPSNWIHDCILPNCASVPPSNLRVFPRTSPPPTHLQTTCHTLDPLHKKQCLSNPNPLTPSYNTSVLKRPKMAPSPQPNAYLNTVLNPSGGSSSSSNSNNNNNNNNNNTTTASTTTPPPRPIRTFAGAPAAQTFNATQRSLQARNKDFHVVGKREESYELRQRREEAARILESTEMLIWWSSARNQVSR